MILAGRRINDNMGQYVASQVIKNMIAEDISPKSARVLVLGLAFKEDCPDVRNTKVVDIIAELGTYGSTVDVHDPWVDADEARTEYGIDLVAEPEQGAYDVVLIAVGHEQFKALGADGIRAFGNETSLVYDIKYVLPQDAADDRL
jgi:UDP-N-acetyl-D-galactosamine dehydrogenase